ncbi:MAG TPA: hypothetical protein VE775_00650 [Pyrinomonadaceae bacterium]|jgi:hypothetical protein|nr:hypothetical protein [Pyrinomonadaceae bacterium]
MKIPVFVSCPTALNEAQDAARNQIISELDCQQLEPRALGRSDYPAEFPLREVYSIATRCAGGIILGFSQFETETGVWKKGTSGAKPQETRIIFPSPWNHLEAGILFGLRLPLLIFREKEISGGIFDVGTSDLFVHVMPTPPLDEEKLDSLRQVFLKWGAKVRSLYYEDMR